MASAEEGQASGHEAGFCAELSLGVGESEMGSLGDFDIGIFVEARKPFPRLALQAIAPEFNARVVKLWEEFGERGEGAHPRVLPVRLPVPAQADPLQVFCCLPLPKGEMLPVRLEIESYDELMDLDLDRMRFDPSSYETYRDDTVRAVVCTHGKVDPCCARRGNATLRALVESPDVEVWHGAHFGGCRFAANVWFLQSGNCYGRVLPEDALSFARSEGRGEVARLGYRGRIGQTSLAAAAEQLLRERYDLWAMPEVVVREVSPTEPGRWKVEADVEGAERVLGLGIRQVSEQVRPLTCRSEITGPPYGYEILDRV